MGIKSKAMSKAETLKGNHENDGGAPTHGLAATHHTTRIADPENISGDGAPPVHEPLMKVHENRGGAPVHGMAAQHHTTRIHDAADVPPEIMDK